MKLSKPMVLGKPRSQPKKVLLRAKTEAELAALIMGQERQIAEHYKLELTGQNLLRAVFHGLRDPMVFKFAYGVSDAEFDMCRYSGWLAYRNKHPAVSVGEEYWKLKYGNNWEVRASKYREAKANPYLLQHWLDKGLSEKEGQQRIQKLKEETSMPMSRWVELYGEDEGKRRHAKQHRFHLNFDESWNGDIEGKLKYTREANRCTVDHWIKRDFSIEQAKQKISEVQKKYSGLHREFWFAKGLSEEQVNEIWGVLNEKKDSSSLKFFTNKYGVKGEERYLQHCLIKSSCYRNHGKLAEDLYPLSNN